MNDPIEPNEIVEYAIPSRTCPIAEYPHTHYLTLDTVVCEIELYSLIELAA